MKLTLKLTKAERNLGLLYLIAEVLILPLLLTVLNRTLPAPLSPGLLNVVFFSINFLCVAGIFHRFLLESLKRLRSRLWPCFRSAFLAFWLYEAANYLLSAVILILRPEFANVNDASLAQMAHANFIPLALATVLLVPMAEECLFRGLFFLELHEKNRALAYAVSVLLFGLIHVIGFIGIYDGITLLLCYIQYIPAGLALAWCYEQSDTIFAPMLLHMTINQLGILSMR